MVSWTENLANVHISRWYQKCRHPLWREWLFSCFFVLSIYAYCRLFLVALWCGTNLARFANVTAPVKHRWIIRVNVWDESEHPNSNETANLHSMDKCKTAVTPLLTHWTYCGLAPIHWSVVGRTTHCSYNAVNVLHNTHNIPLLAYPLGRDIGCVLWAHSLMLCCSHCIALCEIRIYCSVHNLVSDWPTTVNATYHNYRYSFIFFVIA